MEYLLVTGTVDAYGRFTVGWWSNPDPHHDPAPASDDDSDWQVLALDAVDQVLVSSAATLTPNPICTPDIRHNLTALLALTPSTAAVIVRHRGREVYRRDVPEHAEVRLGETFDARQPRGRVEAPLHLGGPPPGPGAYLVAYWRAPGQPLHPLGVTDLGDNTEQTLNLDLTTMPGGAGCRLTTAYFDGVRTTYTTSDELHLEERPARPVILSPRDKTQIFDDTWLSLVGRLNGDGTSDALTWLIDGEPVGHGVRAGVHGLAVGRHTVTLRHGTRQQEVGIEVVPVPVPPHPTPDWAPPWRSNPALY